VTRRELHNDLALDVTEQERNTFKNRRPLSLPKNFKRGGRRHYNYTCEKLFKDNGMYVKLFELLSL